MLAGSDVMRRAEENFVGTARFPGQTPDRLGAYAESRQAPGSPRQPHTDS